MPLNNFSHGEFLENLDTRFEQFATEVVREQNPDTLTVLFGTDVHYIRFYDNYAPVYEKVQEMVEFSRRVGVDLLALTGDLIDGNAPIETQFRDLFDLMTVIKRTDATSVILSQGNHDDCSWFAYKEALGPEGVISDDEWYGAVVNPIRASFPMVLDENNRAGGYYYVDYPTQKIRAINLRTSDNPLVLEEDGKHLVQQYCSQWAFGFQEKQLQWLAKALQLPADDWSVVFFSHTCPYVEETKMHNRDLFADLVRAFRNGDKGVLVSEDPMYPATVSYDFTDRKGDVLVYLYGHYHHDVTKVVDGITTVCTKSLLGFDHGQEHLFVEVPGVGTVGKDIYNSWDCMLIDKAARKLKAKRYGLRALDRDIDL